MLSPLWRLQYLNMRSILCQQYSSLFLISFSKWLACFVCCFKWQLLNNNMCAMLCQQHISLFWIISFKVIHMISVVSNDNFYILPRFTISVKCFFEFSFKFISVVVSATCVVVATYVILSSTIDFVNTFLLFL